MAKRTIRTTVTSIGVAAAIALLAAGCAPEIEPLEPNANDTTADESVPTPTDKPLTENTAVPLPPAPAPVAPGVEAPGSTPNTYVAAGTRQGIANCPIYPRNNAFHADVRKLPKHTESDQIIAAMGSLSVRGPSSTVWEGSRSGYPINFVDSTKVTPTPFYKQGPLLSKVPIGSFPLPANPRLEGDPKPAWDQHLLVVDTATCSSHELFLVRTPALSWLRTWEADAAFTLDLNSNKIPFEASTVSGVSLLAGLVRYDEIAAGKVEHAVSITIPNASNLKPVWPATRTDGKNKDPNAPRMGSWLRLKNVDLSKFGPQSRVIIKAMQDHGAIIMDSNRSGIAVSAENDTRWDNTDMKGLGQLSASDFEVIDPTPMMVSADSYEIR